MDDAELDRIEARARFARDMPDARGDVLALAAEVRRLTAERDALRATVERVDVLRVKWADQQRSGGLGGNAWITMTLAAVAGDLGDALASPSDAPDGGGS